MSLVRLMLMPTLMRMVMPIGDLLLVATLPTLATAVRGVFALATLRATVAAARCAGGAFASRAAATATSTTSAATTATRLATLAAFPVGAAIGALRVLALGTCRDRRARFDAISDVIRNAIRIGVAIYLATAIGIG